MGGLAHVLKVNPHVRIYAPKDRSGVYGDVVPSSTWYRQDPSLPAEQRYYGGTPPEIIHISSLHDKYKVEYVAPGHCTGEPAFAALKKAYGDHFVYAGLGTTLEVTRTPRPLP